MAKHDKIKWDEKYHNDPSLLQREKPSQFVVQYAPMAMKGKAIDLAAGGGRHSCFLASLGFEVVAIELSDVAIDALKKRCAKERVQVMQADLDSFDPSASAYELAVMVNFLDRSLIKRVQKSLKVGALFIVETYMKDPRNEKSGNPDFLLEDKELLALFDKGFEVVDYTTFWSEPYERYKMRKQAIVARKIKSD